MACLEDEKNSEEAVSSDRGAMTGWCVSTSHGDFAVFVECAGCHARTLGINCQGKDEPGSVVSLAANEWNGKSDKGDA